MSTPVPLTPEEETKRRQRRRSIAIGVILGVLVVIFYILTISRFRPS